MSPLLIQISKDFATIWTTTDPIGNVALFVGRLFARDDYFCVVAKPTKEFLAVLPAKSELGDVSEAESANNISEEISLGLIEVGVHHRALGPIHQLCLAEFAMKVVGDLFGDDLASDLHRVDFTTAYDPNRRE